MWRTGRRALGRVSTVVRTAGLFALTLGALFAFEFAAAPASAEVFGCSNKECDGAGGCDPAMDKMCCFSLSGYCTTHTCVGGLDPCPD